MYESQRQNTSRVYSASATASTAAVGGIQLIWYAASILKAP